MEIFHRSSYYIILIAVLFQLGNSQDCRSDDRCTECNLVLFYTSLGNYYMYFCDKCIENASTDSATNVCMCKDGYFKKSTHAC